MIQELFVPRYTYLLEACTAPKPEPASRGGTVWNSYEMAMPMPKPHISSGRTRCQWSRHLNNKKGRQQTPSPR